MCCSGYCVCCDLSQQQKGPDTADQSGSRGDSSLWERQSEQGLTFGLRSRGMGSSGSDSEHLHGGVVGPIGVSKGPPRRGSRSTVNTGPHRGPSPCILGVVPSVPPPSSQGTPVSSASIP